MARCHDDCCNPDPEIESVTLSCRQVGATRKAHQCAACRREIPAGFPALAVAALVDGEFWSGYQHVTDDECDRAEPVVGSSQART